MWKPAVGVSKSLNKGVIAIEPNHLNGWFIQEWNTIIAQRRKTVLWWLCLELFLSK